MKKLLFVLALLIPSIALAQVENLPAGCYVTDEERATYEIEPLCYYTTNLNVFFTPERATPDDLINLYGQTVARFIAQYYFSDLERQTSQGALAAQKALVKKLRRKCGSPCKRIK